MRGTRERMLPHFVTVAVVTAVSVGFALVLIFSAKGLPGVSNNYRLQAVVPTSASLAAGARVTMSGMEVGKVTGVRRRGLGAVIDVEISDEDVTPIPRDSRIDIRQRTAVGENYLAIEPGRSRRTIASGGLLPVSQANDFVDIDQVLSVLQGPTRQRAREIFRSLGEGLDGHGKGLNQVLGGVSGSLQHGANVVRTLVNDRDQVRTLVKQLGAVAGAIGERESSIRQIADKGLVSFRAIADRDSSVGRLLDTLPSTLRQVQTTTRTLETVSGKASPVVTNLAVALREVRPAVRTLRPAATNGRAAITELGRAAPGLSHTLSAVRSLSPPTVTALGKLHNVICQVNPMIRYLKPYTPDVIQTVVGLGSSANSYDATGHLLRLIPIINDNTLVGLPDSLSTAAYKLIHAGLLSKSTALTYDPYPAPGMNGKSVAKAGDHVVGPADVPATGYKYPRIKSDC